MMLSKIKSFAPVLVFLIRLYRVKEVGRRQRTTNRVCQQKIEILFDFTRTASPQCSLDFIREINTGSKVMSAKN